MESNDMEFDDPRMEAEYKEGLADKCEAACPEHPWVRQLRREAFILRAAADAADQFDVIDEHRNPH